jgi:hypothetical protein
MENQHPSVQMRMQSPMHACRYIEFQNTYKIDNDKINYKDKDQSTIILTKSYYTKNPVF